ncbi:MAG: patatin-like phospholipase family protein [Bacillota bacterium]
MRIGLALGSGGLRGAAHIGVIDELERAGICPHMVAGTSSGSLIAAMCGAGMSVAEMEEIALGVQARDIIDSPGTTLFYLAVPLALLFCGQKSRLPKGMLRGARLESFLKANFGDMKMTDLKMPCAVVSVDLHSGEKIVFTSEAVRSECFKGTVYVDGHVADAVRASCSIPGVFFWKEWDGRYLVDGGVREPVPARVLKELGCDYVIAVDLGYTGQADSKVGDLPSIITQSLDILGEEVSDYVLFHYADVVVKPRLYNVALTDVARIPECIEAGRRAAVEALPAIRRGIRRRRIRGLAQLV